MRFRLPYEIVPYQVTFCIHPVFFHDGLSKPLKSSFDACAARWFLRALAVFNEAPMVQTTIHVWPDFAPDETSRDTGTPLPARPGATKPVTRVSGTRRPTINVYLAKNPNGTAILIPPGSKTVGKVRAARSPRLSDFYMAGPRH
jgi:hypothetical protein